MKSIKRKGKSRKRKNVFKEKTKETKMKKINLALIATVLTPALAMAEEGTAAVTHAGNSQIGMVAIGAGLCAGLASSLVGLGQSRAAATAVEGVARNPGAANKVLIPLVLSLALMEGLALLAWLTAGDIINKLGGVAGH
jgi:F-type H+-transporting ATPase subunit c